ncbi:MAG: sterol desaturase family protein [Deltaproteobacteria bacterium]|nr:sterol desaturase family protein [Deltaproteobacteria bacterium]MBW2362716.1 sterol desaturase family protein [Deltaproteobacteria bacterium]
MATTPLSDSSAGAVEQRAGAVLFSWAVFPIAFVGSVALSIRVVDDAGPRGLALAVGIAFGYAIVVVGERLYPFVRDWNRNHDDIPTDAAWMGSTLVIGSAIGPAMTALGAWLGAGLSAQLGSQLWPTDWHLAAQLALALVVVEFFQYWMHRFGHEVELLWRLHATHHSAPRLYWLNASRFHLLEIALLNAGFIVPLAALGAEWPVFMLWIVASSVHGICQHANMQIRCGPLNWIFSMAELHRWHHSQLVRESNTNYGLNLIVWDIVFGTRFLPADRKPPEEIGIPDLSAFPMTWWAQLWAPLRWARIKRESAADATA